MAPVESNIEIIFQPYKRKEAEISRMDGTTCPKQGKSPFVLTDSSFFFFPVNFKISLLRKLSTEIVKKHLVKAATSQL
jgi:hypothetical protein